MRELIFRGKNRINGEWVKGDLMSPHMQNGCEWVIFPTDKTFDGARAVDPSTIGQYIGLNDKNGQQIFEGDIVQADIYQFVVKFGKAGGNYTSRGAYGYMTFFFDPIDGVCRDILRNDPWYWLDRYENASVIGNVHDNPELLVEVGKGE